MTDRIRSFFRDVGSCTLCYGDTPIIVPTPPGKQDIEGAKILLVGEQPHRPSACSSGLLDFDTEDPTVGRMALYLAEAGISRSEVLYVTSVMCVPKNVELRPDRPTFEEAKHCSRHLRKIIELTKPQMIIPLGHTAIQAVQWAYKDWTELRQYILNYDVGRVIERGDVVVYPLYLASSATLRARPEPRQRKDWQRIPVILKSLERKAAAG